MEEYEKVLLKRSRKDEFNPSSNIPIKRLYKLFDTQNNLIASCEALVYRKGAPLPFLKE